MLIWAELVVHACVQGFAEGVVVIPAVCAVVAAVGGVVDGAAGACGRAG
jgi:hypothetical protein